MSHGKRLYGHFALCNCATARAIYIASSARGAANINTAGLTSSTAGEEGPEGGEVV